MRNTEVAKIPTDKDLAERLLMSPEAMYERIIQKSLLEDIGLEEALGELTPEQAGFLPDDALPATVAAQLDTGIFPPATLAEIEYLQLEGKAVGRKEALKKMLASGSMTLADTKGFRTRTAYRLIRQMARVRGLLEGFDMVQSTMNLAPDETLVPLWNMPVPLVDTGFITGNRGIRAVLAKIDEDGETYTFRTAIGYEAFSGSTTLPPPVPDRFHANVNPSLIWKERISRKVPAGYEVKEDRPLILYCEAMTILAEQLDIPRGSAMEPWAGEFGLAGLLNPHTARLSWPTRDELVMYEEDLMLRVFDKASLVSVRATEMWLQRFFGLSRMEAIDITKTSIAVGAMLYNEGTEEMRSLEIKRLDGLEDACDLASDYRAKVAVKRLRLQALGLTRNEESEGMKDMREAAIEGIGEAGRHTEIEEE